MTLTSLVLTTFLLLFSLENNNWIESILILIITAIFLYYRKQSSAHEAYLYTLLDNVSDAIITIDANGSILSLNNAVEEMLGYHPNELIGENIKMLMPSPYSDMHDSYLSNFKQTGQTHIIGKTREVEALRKNGEVFEVELWVHQITYNHEVQFMGVLRDISERKHLDKIKTEFISTVSHELRTPLT